MKHDSVNERRKCRSRRAHWKENYQAVKDNPVVLGTVKKVDYLEGIGISGDIIFTSLMALSPILGLAYYAGCFGNYESTKQ